MRRLAARASAVLGLALIFPAAVHASGSAAALEFARSGEVVRRVELAELKAALSAKRVEVDDPFYGKPKGFLAFRLADVLAFGFGAPVASFEGENFFLRARDGYAKPAPAELLAEDGGYLAFADAAHAQGDDPGWQPIDRRQVDPGPFYVVWAEPRQRDTHRYPWPYQLVQIDRAPFENEYPHTLPPADASDGPVGAGYRIFRRECISCHAINGEGGKIGPDLNIPQSIVEYRPAAQIKAFIYDPNTFRRTTMPPHHHLQDADLDALLAYFGAMKDRKFDPLTAGAP